MGYRQASKAKRITIFLNETGMVNLMKLGSPVHKNDLEAPDRWYIDFSLEDLGLFLKENGVSLDLNSGEIKDHERVYGKAIL